MIQYQICCVELDERHYYAHLLRSLSMACDTYECLWKTRQRLSHIIFTLYKSVTSFTYLGAFLSQNALSPNEWEFLRACVVGSPS